MIEEETVNPDRLLTNAVIQVSFLTPKSRGTLVPIQTYFGKICALTLVVSGHFFEIFLITLGSTCPQSGQWTLPKFFAAPIPFSGCPDEKGNLSRNPGSNQDTIGGQNPRNIWYQGSSGFLEVLVNYLKIWPVSVFLVSLVLICRRYLNFGHWQDERTPLNLQRNTGTPISRDSTNDEHGYHKLILNFNKVQYHNHYGAQARKHRYHYTSACTIRPDTITKSSLLARLLRALHLVDAVDGFERQKQECLTPHGAK
ncbi:hypothetical protein LENED_011032 [Lentinula edodes]|uniref:Uncharacterized protein n=1 Tax=Lentinula edodes TaxID=5353 RepID=A0A1Q3ENY3_LENED|nr:hypothetical protein LENED_011032 [Lentinula edodes]